jgi:hypothetical protein
MDKQLGTYFDAELDPSSKPADGAPDSWLHQVV